MKRIYSIIFYLSIGALLLGIPQAYSTSNGDGDQDNTNRQLVVYHKSLEEKYLDLYQELTHRFPKIKFRIQNNQIIGERTIIIPFMKEIHTLSLDLVESDAGFKGENLQYSHGIEWLSLSDVTTRPEGQKEILSNAFTIGCCVFIGFFAIVYYLQRRIENWDRIPSLKNGIISDKISVSSRCLYVESIISGLQQIASSTPTSYEKERNVAIKELVEAETKLALLEAQVDELASLAPSSPLVEETREAVKDYENKFQKLRNDIAKLDAAASIDKKKQDSNKPKNTPGGSGHSLLILLLMLLLMLGGVWLWTKKSTQY